jgi:hypothetical protein
MEKTRSRSTAGVVLLLVVLAFVVLKYVGTISRWKLTHWLFSYELGFVKRGLVGTVLQAVSPGGVVTAESVVEISLAIAALFAFGLGALAFPLFAETGRQRSLLIALVALLAPGIGYVLADLGRFDILNLLLCLASILVARRTGRFPFAMFLVVSCVLVLIHEAALALAVPTLFVAYLHANGRLGALADPRQWAGLGVRLAPALLLGAALLTFGRSDLALPELLARLVPHADFPPQPRSAYVLVRSLESNVLQVLGGQSASSEVPLGSVELVAFWMVLGVALPQQLLAHISFLPLDRERRLPVLIALHLCFAAPFVLMSVGVDWARWAALSSAQCATLMLLFARDLPAAGEACLPRSFVAAALGFLVVAAGSGYGMQGARSGMGMSPQTNVLLWLDDMQRAKAWHDAFQTGQVVEP